MAGLGGEVARWTALHQLHLRRHLSAHPGSHALGADPALQCVARCCRRDSGLRLWPYGLRSGRLHAARSQAGRARGVRSRSRASAGAGHRFARASALRRSAVAARGGLRVCAGMRSRARGLRAGRARRRRSHLDSHLRLFRRTDWSRGLPGTEPRRAARSRHRSVCPVCGECGRQNGASRAAHRSFRDHSSRPCVSARFS